MFPKEMVIDDVAQNFSRNRHWAQIVGPHGSGKSTLAIAVANHLKSKFDSIVMMTLLGGNSLKRKFIFQPSNPRKTDKVLHVVDGLEKLSKFQRQLILYHQIKLNLSHGHGFVFTTHRTWNQIPILFETSPDTVRFYKLVKKLHPTMPAPIIRQAFEKHRPNCREALMELYDVYESLCFASR
ncbi:MAG: hypothetical protein AAF623_17005 [Planctomycetota bacterium]